MPAARLASGWPGLRPGIPPGKGRKGLEILAQQPSGEVVAPARHRCPRIRERGKLAPRGVGKRPRVIFLVPLRAILCGENAHRLCFGESFGKRIISRSLVPQKQRSEPKAAA
jgi:hypothetical protein